MYRTEVVIGSALIYLTNSINYVGLKQKKM